MSVKKSVMVFVQQSDGVAAEASLELVCKARELAGRLGVRTSAAFIGHDIRQAAARVAAYGVDEMYLVEGPRLKDYSPVPYAKVMTEIIKKLDPQIVLFGATTTGRDLAPRIASALKVGLTADCTDLRIGDHQTKDKTYKDILYQIRPAFGGNIIATIVSPDRLPQMATVREGVMRMTAPDPAYKTTFTDFPFELGDQDFPSEIVERVREAKRVNLKGAQVIVSGGMGVGNKANFDLVVKLAEILGGVVGASRAAVDAGWV
ncbi:MAG: electron transfer flavoprotein subunit alpha/FixB family protein, partial [Spirochaetaceae bacterium]|nr:electron transfer flavoprotein subunit alpha/FixB family protein [Spirochaetaceae bacterium]